MDGRHDSGAAGHFGRQMRKERVARGWSIAELAKRMGVDAAHLGRVESGKRPPTEKLALACDVVFPERRGWFAEYYEESRSWTPPAFRNWAEYEDKAVSLRTWSPGVVHGLAQTEAYARALLQTSPGATAEMVAGRLTARMERQRRVLMRDDPPATWFIVDALSLCRQVGSAKVMATQMRHLLTVAAMPRVTMQILPAVAHPAGASGFVIADGAAYAEHVGSGYVFTDEQTVSSVLRLFHSIHSESHRASESLRMIERLGELWESGASPLTATLTAETA
jgi:transcriptional regulator with XRE-family HTH domain